jgi:hypothetical protein
MPFLPEIAGTKKCSLRERLGLSVIAFRRGGGARPLVADRPAAAAAWLPSLTSEGARSRGNSVDSSTPSEGQRKLIVVRTRAATGSRSNLARSYERERAYYARAERSSVRAPTGTRPAATAHGQLPPRDKREEGARSRGDSVDSQPPFEGQRTPIVTESPAATTPTATVATDSCISSLPRSLSFGRPLGRPPPADDDLRPPYLELEEEARRLGATRRGAQMTTMR